MPLNFEATRDFQSALSDVETLVSFAKLAADNGEDKNRELFLKLSVSSLVTKFQVFIESLLKEYNFSVATSNRRLCDFPIHLRLNSLKIYSTEKTLEKRLSDTSQYNINKLNELKGIIEHMNGLCNENTIVNQEFKVNTKFPLGKTGSGEVIGLFKQLNGENIFEGIAIDTALLDEILWKRHSIIHEDVNPQLTEPKIEDYIQFVRDLSEKIDDYTSRYR